MNTIKIAFFDSKQYDIDSFEKMNRDYGFKLKFYKERLSADTAFMAQGYDGVCLFVNDSADAAAIDKLVENKNKLIAMRCAGYNNVDLKHAFGRIHIVRVPSYSPHAVAEHALALMMTLNRKTHKAYGRVRDNNFTINGLLGFDMYGKTAGVIGTGKIGGIMASILVGLGMRVLAYDAYPNTELAKKTGFEYCDLDTIYSESDIVTLHCPLLPETEHIINADSIAKMKEGVMIINTSRGKLIDSKALINGLKSRKIGFAGLDVYEEEADYFFEDYSAEVLYDDVLARLLTFNNVLVTSHQAFFTREAIHNIAKTTLQNIRDFFDGKELTNEICYHCGQDHSNCDKVKTGHCF